MTDFKAKGFDSPAQLWEHLDDVEDTNYAAEEAQLDSADDPSIREVAWLRKEVSDLRLQLEAINGGVEVSGTAAAMAVGRWQRIAGMLALTYVLGRILQGFRLGSRALQQ